jgi:hypothetical protein
MGLSATFAADRRGRRGSETHRVTRWVPQGLNPSYEFLIQSASSRHGCTDQ